MAFSRFIILLSAIISATAPLLSGSILSAPAVERFKIVMNEGAGSSRIEVISADGISLLMLEVMPDKAGRSIELRTKRGKEPVSKMSLAFAPSEKNVRLLENLKTLGIERMSWIDRPLPGKVRFVQDAIQIWIMGKLALNERLPLEIKCSLKTTAGKNARIVWQSSRAEDSSIYEPVEFSHFINDSDATAGRRLIDGVPFDVWNEGAALLSLEHAGWPEAKMDPSSYVERYDAEGLLYFEDKGRMPVVQIPQGDYCAAYILASMEDKPGFTNGLTLRFGHRSTVEAAQVSMKDFPATVTGKALHVIRIPLTENIAHNIEGNVMDMEITKEIRLARRSPDPSRFRWRPLGLPSGVKIAAITLEKSPIQMEVHPIEPGALFEEPQAPSFRVRLTNITEHSQSSTVKLASGDSTEEWAATIEAGKAVEKDLELKGLPLGHHRLNVNLFQEGRADVPLVSYHTMFGTLPKDSRKYRAESPWGTWDFSGVHFTPDDPSQIGPVMQKLGLRYGMFDAGIEARQHYGVIKGSEFKVTSNIVAPEKADELYAKALAKNPDLLSDVLIFHEDAISADHATRAPDLFADRPPYKLNEEEQQRFEKLWKIASESAKAIRNGYPAAKINFGNGGLALREEFYRHGFPSELFDTAGNEAASFGRPPESQPPDIVANNASLWMDRQLLDAYGYEGKPISQCYEITYPGTNPGNLSFETQSDYFIRHILHSMVWGIPRIRIGCISDVGNSYYHSNWGASGFFTARPEWAPKPAALSLATLTRVLDGAKYEGFVETGSESAYLLRFRNQSELQILPLWVVRGERPFYLRIDGTKQIRLISPEGRAQEVAIKDGIATVTATSSVHYVELPAGASLTNVSLVSPSYPDSAPRGKTISLTPFRTLDGWRISEERNRLLEFYNPMTPRSKGQFAFEEERMVEATGSALKVVPLPISGGKPTMPMYAELISTHGIPLSGKPAEIGLSVYGNSSWGRIIFELEDASGQTWTSIGARSKGGSDWMKDWVGKEMSDQFKPGEMADWNTDDVFGLSRINFDGWRYVGFPLPGQYPGEGFPWPANSQWRSDKDGVVHYPLVLRKIIVELPRKTLYLTRFEKPKRPEIYLRDIVAVERDTDAPKSTVGSYTEDVQVNLR